MLEVDDESRLIPVDTAMPAPLETGKDPVQMVIHNGVEMPVHVAQAMIEQEAKIVGE